MIRRSYCRLGTTYRVGPWWLHLTVLNRFEAWSLYYRRRRIAWKPIDYSRYD